jgi:hypothetical protein
MWGPRASEFSNKERANAETRGDGNIADPEITKEDALCVNRCTLVCMAQSSLSEPLASFCLPVLRRMHAKSYMYGTFFILLNNHYGREEHTDSSVEHRASVA